MFKLGHTPAHKGKMTTADPVKTLEAVQKVKHHLEGVTRDFALWMVAIHTALRSGDLCNLTWDDAYDDGSTITLRVLEGKTRKPRTIPLGGEAARALRAWRAKCDHAHIYSGQRGRLTTATWSRMVKGWCEAVGLQGAFSGHTTRKTWARVQHDHFKTSMATLMHALNHSSERQTMTYIGRLTDDLARAYSNAL